MTMPPSPRYAVECDEDGSELGRFATMSGLFARGSATGGRHRLTLRNGSIPPALQKVAGRALPRPLGNLHIVMLDRDGRAIGRYFLADVRLSRAEPNRAGLWNIILLVPLVRSRPGTARIWERFAMDQPRSRNAWAELPPAGQRAWLDVVRLRSGAMPPPVDAPPGTVFELDARLVTNRAGFFCALGEAVNGPGGYFGADADGLADCFAGGFGARPPFTLRWRVAKGDTPEAAAVRDGYEDLLDTLRRHGVTIIGVS
jgi:Barstar (barnase inhibitor)